jgi:hypothetical protein
MVEVSGLSTRQMRDAGPDLFLAAGTEWAAAVLYTAKLNLSDAPPRGVLIT